MDLQNTGSLSIHSPYDEHLDEPIYIGRIWNTVQTNVQGQKELRQYASQYVNLMRLENFHFQRLPPVGGVYLLRMNRLSRF